MTVHFSSGKINWTPATAGEYPVSVTATNSNGADTQDFTILVHAPNQAPNIISDPVTAASAGQNYLYDVEATGNPTPVLVQRELEF
jgi:PKD repeat protein